MPRNKLASNSARLATVVPMELAEYINHLAENEERSTSQFLAMFLKEHFGSAAIEFNKSKQEA